MARSTSRSRTRRIWRKQVSPEIWPAGGGVSRSGCNAGGVTASNFEWVQDEQHLFWEAQDIYNRLERVMKTAFRDVLKIHLDRNVPMRIAAKMPGIGRVAEAVQIRGIYP
jgi:glutamate dehydrogenase/leucine dehydrogenase